MWLSIVSQICCKRWNTLIGELQRIVEDRIDFQRAMTRIIEDKEVWKKCFKILADIMDKNEKGTGRKKIKMMITNLLEEAFANNKNDKWISREKASWADTLITNM
ncbi:hypothetical protein HHI36_020314 [Cryptolaemus montrouzieri]|uniref:Uncharacterized protein n=1 Tax=Cryptolaemus montrouzieri TaxID=559131 RepID=A0ABD2NAB9_9CUCU